MLLDASVRRYRAALATPHVTWLLLTSLVGRLPQGMIGLSLVMLVTSRGESFAHAGLVVSAYVIGTAAGSPLLGRLADRVGRRWVLVPSATASASALAGLALLPERAGLPAVIAVAALSGLLYPPLSASARSLWPQVLPSSQRATMYAAEATFQELIFVLGPALASALVVLSSPRAALFGCVLLGLGGTLAFAASPAAAMRPAPPEGGRASLASAPGLKRLFAVGLLGMVAFSMTELAVVAFATDHGARVASGLLLALWGAGSMAGGLLVGARTGGGRLRARLALVALGLLPLAAAPGVIPLGVLLAAGGAAIAPMVATLFNDLGKVAPAGRTTEVFAWASTGFMAGAALGAAGGGALIEASGPAATFLAAAAAVLAGSVLAPVASRLEPA